MNSFSCPSCGGKVLFKSGISLYTTCSYCRQCLIRDNLNIKSLGVEALLLEDMSPLQVGSMGSYDKKSFDVLGKIRWEWSAGFWNEWYLGFSSGTFAWLAEAQGFWMLSYPEKLPVEFTNKVFKVGDRLNLNSKVNFEINDIKKVKSCGYVGEVPQCALANTEILVIDASGSDQLFASISQSESETSLYIGKYVNFEDLQMTNLREIEGWSR